MTDYIWNLIVENGRDLAAKDSNGKSDPFVVVELLLTDETEYGYDNVETDVKMTTPVIQKTLNPEWNYLVYSLKASSTFEKFKGVRIRCWDKDKFSKSDFMGEAYLWFGKDIPFPPNDCNCITGTLNPKKGSKSKVTGYITLSSYFAPIPLKAEKPNRPVLSRMGSSVDATAYAMNSSKYVTVSSTGRREVKVPTTGQEKFVTFGQLPTLDVNYFSQHEHGFDYNLALWLATSCCLVYKKEEYVEAVVKYVWDMNDFKFIDDKSTDTQAFIMANDSFVTLCYRGTESIRDWVTNLNFVLISPQRIPERYLKCGVKVHNGFNDSLLSVWDEISEYIIDILQRKPYLKFYICGHSLGGALANLSLGYFALSDNPIHVDAVYTVGQPCVGNRKFRQQLELATQDTKYFRITNNQDCVPSLASGQHCGDHLHIDAKGRTSFNPSTWNRAVQSVSRMKGAAVSMQYAGIADHGSPKYKRVIEKLWVKAAPSGEKSESYSLCEILLYLIDMLQEDIKSVLRYKVQFRAFLSELLKTRPLLQVTEGFLSVNIPQEKIDEIKEILIEITKLMHEVKKIVLHRQKKKSKIQQLSTSKFNQKMTVISSKFQVEIARLHNVLSSLDNKNCSIPDRTYGWEPQLEVPEYSSKVYEAINFIGIDYKKLDDEVRELRKQKEREDRQHITILLEEAEHLCEEGKVESAHLLLKQIASGTASVGTLSISEKALYTYLKAKVHATLFHRSEALEALKELSNIGEDSALLQEEVFISFKNDKDFAEIEKQWGKAVLEEIEEADSLNEMEKHMLASLFDLADENGDNVLTVKEFSDLIESTGLETLLDNLGWLTLAGEDEESESYQKLLNLQKERIEQILITINEKYGGAVTLDQFIFLMSGLAPQD